MNDNGSRCAVIGVNLETMLVEMAVVARQGGGELNLMASRNLLPVITSIETARRLWRTVIDELDELLVKEEK